jgi:hypothetical protein
MTDLLASYEFVDDFLTDGCLCDVCFVRGASFEEEALPSAAFDDTFLTIFLLGVTCCFVLFAVVAFACFFTPFVIGVPFTWFACKRFALIEWRTTRDGVVSFFGSACFVACVWPIAGVILSSAAPTRRRIMDLDVMTVTPLLLMK